MLNGHARESKIAMAMMRNGFSLIEALAAVALLALAAIPLYEMSQALTRAAERLTQISNEIEEAGDRAALRALATSFASSPDRRQSIPRSLQDEPIYAGGHYGFQLVEIEFRAVTVQSATQNDRISLHIAYRPRYDSVEQFLDETL